MRRRITLALLALGLPTLGQARGADGPAPPGEPHAPRRILSRLFHPDPPPVRPDGPVVPAPISAQAQAQIHRMIAPPSARPGGEMAPAPAPPNPAAAQPATGPGGPAGPGPGQAPAPSPTQAPAAGQPAATAARPDGSVVRTQTPGQAMPEALPVVPPEPSPTLPAVANPSFAAEESIGAQSLSLQAALYGTLTGNPDLLTLRQGSPIANAPSPEAVEVARRFPTTLNPTIWIDYRPITLIPQDPFSSNPGGGAQRNGSYYHFGQQYLLLSYRQPVELGHQTKHRYHIARAALDQQRWTVTQAELTALVQTYRLFQTAAYRREKLRIARELAEFNERLLQTLQRRLEANQGSAADVVLARVEARAAGQQVSAARQDYVTALTDLRNQIGLPETAAAAEPLGEFTLPAYIPPIDEAAMIQTAVDARPDVHAAMAQVRGADAAVRLARGDMIPTPIIGPQYAIDEAGLQYVGLIYVTPLPFVNSGKPLLRQRQAEAARARVALQSAQQRAVAQVRAAVVKWNGATELVNETSGLSDELSEEVSKLELLFDEGQADLTKLLQGRQRLLQLENSRLDAVWAATQAQADLLLALGAPSLIHGMLAQAEGDAGMQAPTTPAP